jgi:hypothetical protein
MENNFTSPEIEKLEARDRELVTELDAVRALIHEKRLDFQGIKIGDLIEDTLTGATYQISEVIFGQYSGPWISGYKRLKDGRFGQSPHCLHSSWRRIAIAKEG